MSLVTVILHLTLQAFVVRKVCVRVFMRKQSSSSYLSQRNWQDNLSSSKVFYYQTQKCNLWNLISWAAEVTWGQQNGEYLRERQKGNVLKGTACELLMNEASVMCVCVCVSVVISTVQLRTGESLDQRLCNKSGILLCASLGGSLFILHTSRMNQ